MIPCTLMCVYGGNGSCHKKLGLVCKMEPEEGAQWDACETMGCAYRGYVYPLWESLGLGCVRALDRTCAMYINFNFSLSFPLVFSFRFRAHFQDCVLPFLVWPEGTCV